VAWRDLPERYGPWKTVHNRFRRWSRNSTLTMLAPKAQVITEAVDELDRRCRWDRLRRSRSSAVDRATGGNVNGCTRFEQVMAGICVLRHPRRRPGPPWRRPVRMIADKGYSSRASHRHPHDKTAQSYQNMIDLATLLMWL